MSPGLVSHHRPLTHLVTGQRLEGTMRGRERRGGEQGRKLAAAVVAVVEVVVLVLVVVLVMWRCPAIKRCPRVRAMV